MANEELTLLEIEQRLQCLKQEELNDQAAVRAGHIRKDHAIERSIHRQAEQRWLEMEAMLLKAAKGS
jgi:hypothetical protein